MSGRTLVARCSATRILPNSDHVVTGNNTHVEVRCVHCNRKIKYKLRTYQEYIRKGHKFQCRYCIRDIRISKNMERILGKCSVCGKEYAASRHMYVWKERQGRPNYCPECRRVKQGLTASQVNRERKEQRETMLLPEYQQYVGPCGSLIKRVPLHRNQRHKETCQCLLCNMLDDGRYDRCLTRASDWGWDGWRVVKGTEQMIGGTNA